MSTVKILPNSRTETRLEKLVIQKAKDPCPLNQITYESRLSLVKMYETKTLTISCLRILLVIKPCVFTAEEALKIGVRMMILGNSMPFGSPNVFFLLLKKTPAFVEAVHEKYKSLLSSKKDAINEISSTESEQSITLCKICFKDELAIVFSPCGHMVACTDCASAFKECPVCRKNIQATVHAFLS